MPSPRRVVAAPASRILAAGLYAALAAATATIVGREPVIAHAGDSRWALAAQLAAGALLVAAALTVRRPAAGPLGFPALLIAAALAWPLAEWNTPGAGSGFAAGLVLYAAWPAFLAAAALRGPDERPLGRPAWLVVGLALVTSIGALGLVSAVVFDPVDAQGCFRCPANHLLIASDARAWHELGQTGLALTAAWVATFAVVALVRLSRSSPARRRLVAPVVVPAVAVLTLFGLDALHGTHRGFLSSDHIDRALWKGEIAALALTAAGVAWGRVRARRTRTALARLVVDLGASPATGGLRARLAVALGDPTLELLHRIGDGPAWIDGEGRAATPAAGPGREATRIVAAGREISTIVHRRGLLDDPAVVAEIGAAVGLALEHERLHATRRAHLQQLRASRARIVSTADTERRQLERDLHDGAQQRLVTLTVGVRLARREHAAADPTLDGELAAAEEELRGAVGELRELAHGLFPSILDEEGLTAAIEVLAEREPRLVLDTLPDSRCSPPVESAAYFVVGEALRLTAGGDITVHAATQDGRLVIEIRSASELTEDPIRIEDRVGALGGALAIDAHRLQAELPCGS